MRLIADMTWNRSERRSTDPATQLNEDYRYLNRAQTPVGPA
jgi:hypothetical protein